VRFVILRLGLRGVLLRAPGRIERPPGTLEAIAARHAREVSFGVSPFADPAAAMP
jgi:hypothetical protein